MRRRTFLAGSLVLAGCGDTKHLNRETKELQRRSVAIDYASYYAPIEDVRRLAQARAAAVGAQLTLSDDKAGVDAQLATLKRWAGPRGGFSAIAIAPFDVPSVDPVAGSAVEVGIAIIAYVTELANQSAAITVDRGRAGALLAARAPAGPALLVRPGRPPVPDPFAPGFADAETALRAGVEVVGQVSAVAADDARSAVAAALRATPGVRSILCWNDQTALGAADVADGRFVGGLGAPSLSGRAAVGAVRAGKVDCLVAPRLSGLAAALVDLPLAYARGQDPGSRDIPVAVLTARSPQLRAFASDFSA